MCEFKHGDAIEYEVAGQWREGIYIAPHPTNTSLHVHVSHNGYLNERCIDKIRKPKQKREGWIGFMETRDTHNRWETGVYSSEAALIEITDKMGSRLVSIGKVKWEE